jgi:hypothetical protein
MWMKKPASLFAIALFFGLSAGFENPGPPSQGCPVQGTAPGVTTTDFQKLIEVHGPETAYIPSTAKYVKYDGVVRRIVKFSETLEEGEDCPCPRCCDGRCYVIIFTDPITPGGPLRVPYILWLEC